MKYEFVVLNNEVLGLQINPNYRSWEKWKELSRARAQASASVRRMHNYLIST